MTREVATTHLVTGKEVVVRCSARPIRLDGRILGAVAINTDITAEKRVEAALAQQAEELQQFAHVAGHDLQAPLRMIKSYAQLLARRYGGQMDPIADQFLRAITDGVDAMEQLTRGLLQFAEAGEDAGERTAVRVETVIDGVLAALQPSIEESGAEVICGELPTVTNRSFAAGAAVPEPGWQRAQVSPS